MKTTNAKSREFSQYKEEFEANNLKGVNEGCLYVVYSYKWYPLFVFSYVTHKWYENKDKYSVSTSKQTGQCRPRAETVLMSHEELKDLIANTKSGERYDQMKNLGVAV